MFSLAQAHGLTVYDAAYLNLAMQEGLPLASLDRQLLRAARPLSAGAASWYRPRCSAAARKQEDLASRPGKLTLAMAITRAHNGADVTCGSLVVREPAGAQTVSIQVVFSAFCFVMCPMTVTRPVHFWLSDSSLLLVVAAVSF